MGRTARTPRPDAARDTTTTAAAGVSSSTVRTLVRLARALERSVGELTLAQYRVLSYVGDGRDRATEVAGGLSLSKPTVSTMVDALVERGFLEREVVEEDRRAIRLVVTRAGRDALDAAELEMRTRLDGLLARVEDPAAVERALASLEVALDEARAERHRDRDAGAAEPVAAGRPRR
jgi:DNA-binding MarR family transcriptional regulator